MFVPPQQERDNLFHHQGEGVVQKQKHGRMKIPLSDPQPLRKSGTQLSRSSSSWRRSDMSDSSGNAPRPILRPLPPLAQAQPDQRAELFIQKVRQCAVILDWSSPYLDIDEKEVKRAALKELSAFIGHPNLRKDAFTDPAAYAEVFRMVELNLFLGTAPRTAVVGPVYDPEDEEPILEDAWPHLRLVYKLLLRYLESPALKVPIAQHALSTRWILQLLHRFRTEDPRERSYLKTSLHRIYGRFLDFRLFIRQHIAYTFHELVSENEIHPGIAEILEVLGTIINGYALPLKEEHTQFLRKALLPLHKVSTAAGYYSQLVYCIYQYLSKQPSLAPTIFEAIVRYWPKVNSPKELMFLSEVDELLAICHPKELKPVVDALFRRIGASMGSQHFQVAEKALCLWRKKHFVKVVRHYLPRVVPCVYAHLEANAEGHWHKAVRVMSLSLLRELTVMDPDVVDRARDAKPPLRSVTCGSAPHIAYPLPSSFPPLCSPSYHLIIFRRDCACRVSSPPPI